VAALKRCAQAWFALRCPVHIEFNKQEFASYGSASQSGKLTALAHFAADGPRSSPLLRSRSCFWEGRVLACRSERGPPPVGSSPDPGLGSRAAQRMASPRRYVGAQMLWSIPAL